MTRTREVYAHWLSLGGTRTAKKNSINSSHPYERLSVVHANELNCLEEYSKFVSCLNDGE